MIPHPAAAEHHVAQACYDVWCARLIEFSVAACRAIASDELDELDELDALLEVTRGAAEAAEAALVRAARRRIAAHIIAAESCTDPDCDCDPD